MKKGDPCKNLKFKYRQYQDFLYFLQNDVVIKMLVYDTMVEVYREYPSESYYTRF